MPKVLGAPRPTAHRCHLLISLWLDTWDQNTPSPPPNFDPPPYLHSPALSPCPGTPGCKKRRHREGKGRRVEEGETEPSAGKAGRARKRREPGRAVGNRSQRRRVSCAGSQKESGRRGQTAQGGDLDAGSRFVHCCCGSIFAISPSPPASPCNAAGCDGPVGETPRSPPSAPPGFRGTQGRVRVAAQRLPG